MMNHSSKIAAPNTKLKHILFMAALVLLCSPLAKLQADALLDIDGSKDRLILPEVIQQDVAKPDIDKEDFEILAYVGSYSIEGFNTQPLLGFKASFFITPDFFIDLDYGTSYIKGRTNPDQASTSIDQRLNRYDLSLAYNLLEGQSFGKDGSTYTNHLYVKYGLGNIDSQSTKSTYGTLGIGLRIINASDKYTIHTGFNHDNVFSADSDSFIAGTNLKFFVGLGMYF